MKQHIIGIQQVGVGIPDLTSAWSFYRKAFFMNVPVFQEEAEAKLMTYYTGGKVHARNAVLAINMQGGGGLEIWQYTSRKTAPANFEIQLGDLGIYIAKIKCRDIHKLYSYYKQQGIATLGGIQTAPNGVNYLLVKDPYGSIFQVVEYHNWFSENNELTGGVFGSVIGVSDMNQSLRFYALLGFDKVVYDETNIFDEFSNLPSGNQKYRRVLLEKSTHNSGSFSELLGTGQIELIQPLERVPVKIFENRYWGDLGFIHLCFDVKNMNEIKEYLTSKGHPFTVDTDNSFDMGEAAGRFSYIEDPDGTLIEFVETHKVPILKKIGWYLHLSKRDSNKPLPKWMLKALGLNKVKN